MGKAWFAFFVLACAVVTWMGVADALHLRMLSTFTGTMLIAVIFAKVWK